MLVIQEALEQTFLKKSTVVSQESVKSLKNISKKSNTVVRVVLEKIFLNNIPIYDCNPGSS